MHFELARSMYVYYSYRDTSFTVIELVRAVKAAYRQCCSSTSSASFHIYRLDPLRGLFYYFRQHANLVTELV
jgi:hypothetical protein